MKKPTRIFSSLVVVILAGCSTATPATAPRPTQTQSPEQEPAPMTDSALANVLTVTATGNPNAYQFEVKVSSPDTGCDQYADWWEVLSEDGELIYRRVLLHSHVDEQPFTRSGGPVPIDENTVVLVRAHMNTSGYGGQILKGSIADGFLPVDVIDGFGADVETFPPQPDGCAF